MKSNRTQIFLVGLVIVVITIAFVLFTDGCESKTEKRTAVSYHDSIVIHQKRIVDQTDKLNAAIETYVREDMDKELENLNNQLMATATYLLNTTPFENDTTLRKGLKMLTDRYKAMADKEYLFVVDRMKKDDASFTEADQQYVDSLNKEIDRKTELIYKDFAARVKKFRMEYNILVK